MDVNHVHRNLPDRPEASFAVEVRHYWSCANPDHRHSKREAAAICLANAARLAASVAAICAQERFRLERMDHIVLRRMSGDTLSSIASDLGISPGRVGQIERARWRKHRAHVQTLRPGRYWFQRLGSITEQPVILRQSAGGDLLVIWRDERDDLCRTRIAELIGSFSLFAVAPFNDAIFQSIADDDEPAMSMDAA